MEGGQIFHVYLRSSNRLNFSEPVKSLQALHDGINCDYCAVLFWNDLASIILEKTGENKKSICIPNFITSS